MGVTESDGQRIGSVFLGALLQLQQILHHFSHLVLFRAAFADHCLLYLASGIFEHRNMGLHNGRNGGPRACPSFRAESALRAIKTFSMLTSAGPNSFTT